MMDDWRYFDGLAQELFGKLHRVTNFTKHGPSIGHYHEVLVRELLRNFLSDRFSVRTGFAYRPARNRARASVGQTSGYSGRASKQGDIIIVDENDPAPYYFRQDDFVVVNPRAVAAVIEVKTRLNKATFIDSIDNLASFGPVVGNGSSEEHIPYGFVFAFEGQAFSEQILRGWYRDAGLAHEDKNYPAAIVSLKRGLIMRVGPGKEFGHGTVLCGDESKLGVQSLSIFLAILRKVLEARCGIDSNPFEFSHTDDVVFGKYRYEFGRQPVSLDVWDAPS